MPRGTFVVLLAFAVLLLVLEAEAQTRKTTKKPGVTQKKNAQLQGTTKKSAVKKTTTKKAAVKKGTTKKGVVKKPRTKKGTTKKPATKATPGLPVYKDPYLRSLLPFPLAQSEETTEITTITMEEETTLPTFAEEYHEDEEPGVDYTDTINEEDNFSAVTTPQPQKTNSKKGRYKSRSRKEEQESFEEEYEYTKTINS